MWTKLRNVTDMATLYVDIFRQLSLLRALTKCLLWSGLIKCLHHLFLIDCIQHLLTSVVIRAVSFELWCNYSRHHGDTPSCISCVIKILSILFFKRRMKDCLCDDEGGGDELASSEEGRVQQSRQSDFGELVNQQQQQQQQAGGRMERLMPGGLYLDGCVNYLRWVLSSLNQYVFLILRARSWGLQLLIRLTLREKQLGR